MRRTNSEMSVNNAGSKRNSLPSLSMNKFFVSKRASMFESHEETTREKRERSPCGMLEVSERKLEARKEKERSNLMKNRRKRQTDPYAEESTEADEFSDIVPKNTQNNKSKHKNQKNGDTDCRICGHANRSVNLHQVRKSLKQNIPIGECVHCKKGIPLGSSITAIREEEHLHPIDENYVPVIWLCTYCGYQGCDRHSIGKHAFKHYQTPHSDPHCLVINTQAWTVWCYECDSEVVVTSSKKLSEVIQFVKHRSEKAPRRDVRGMGLSVPTHTTNLTSQYSGSDSRLHSSTHSENQIKSFKNMKNHQASVVASLPKVKGLSNLGNTCFFNSVLQVLSQTHYLTQLLDVQLQSGQRLSLPGREDRRRKDRKKEYKTDSGKYVAATCDDEDTEDEDNIELKPLELYLPEGGTLSLAFLTFLKDMHNMNKSGIVNPGHVLGQICKKSQQFRGYQQQDSHELLRCLLDQIRQEEIIRHKKSILKAFALSEKVDPKSVNQRLKTMIKGYGKQGAHTIVDQIFGGHLISTVLCESCHWSSQVFEPMMDLSLPINEEKGKPRKSNYLDDAPPNFGRSKYSRRKERRKEKRKTKEVKSNITSNNPGVSIIPCIRGDDIEENEREERRKRRLTEKRRPSEEREFKLKKEKEAAERRRLEEQRRKKSKSRKGPDESSRFTLLSTSKKEEKAKKEEEEDKGGSRDDEEESEEQEYDVDDDEDEDSLVLSKRMSLLRMGLNSINNKKDVSKHVTEEEDDSDEDEDEEEEDEEDEDEEEEDEESSEEEDSDEEEDSSDISSKRTSKCKKLSRETSDADVEDNNDSEYMHRIHSNTRQPSIFVETLDGDCESQPTNAADRRLSDVFPAIPRYLTSSNSYDALNYSTDVSEAYFTAAGADTMDELDEPNYASLSQSPTKQMSNSHHYNDRGMSQLQTDDIYQKIGDLKHRRSRYGSRDSLLDAPNNNNQYRKRGSTDAIYNFQSQTADDEESASRKNSQIKKLKQEWISRSLTTLTKRYDCGREECSVMSCLTNFTSPELITGNNKIICDNCNKLRQSQGKDDTSPYKSNASKQMLLLSPPAVLTLHLKRFHHVGYNLTKVNRHVQFPLVLDVAPFTSSISQSLSNMAKDQSQVLYGLFGIVEHSGRLNSGHYVSYVRCRPLDITRTSKHFLNLKPATQFEINQLVNDMAQKMQQESSNMTNGGFRGTSASRSKSPSQGCFTKEDLEDEIRKGRWFYASDTHVSEVNIEKVLRAQAYLLFYERLL